VKGSCACGTVRWEATPPSKFVAHCHCDHCRKAHGAAFVTYAGFPDGRFRWTAGEQALTRWSTPTEAERTFCSQCGTTLTYRGPRWPEDVHVAVGTFDEPPDREPAAHVYVDHGVSWFTIADELPQRGGATGMEPKV